MKILKYIALIAFMIFVAYLSETPGIRAADSFTVTAVGSTEITDIGTGWANSFKVLKAAWKSAPSTGIKTNETIPPMKGKLVMVVTDPGATAPSDNYDLYIKDSTGTDVLGGAGENRDTANSEQAFPKTGTDFYVRRPIYGSMTFSLSGNSNADANGDVYLYFEE